jgi:dihydrofolate reductase
MRQLRYQVAASLDGFIAGPKGDYDWIVSDPSIDFGALFKEFDTAVMGRKTYEVMTAQGGTGAMKGLDVMVFSRSLSPTTMKGVRITKDDAADAVRALKKQPGGDIWLFGGGALFRSLLDARLVDTVEVALIPVLLGEGIPLLPAGASTRLELVDQITLPASGIVCPDVGLAPASGTSKLVRPRPSDLRVNAPNLESPSREPSEQQRRARRRRVHDSLPDSNTLLAGRSRFTA